MENNLEILKLQYRIGRWSCNYTTSFQSGRWYVMSGLSGSGKSTLLHLMTGFLSPSFGEVRMGNENISGLAPHKRSLGFMSQGNSLFPGITLLENLLLPLHESKDSHTVKRTLIKEIAERLGLDPDVLNRSPANLSGGQLSRCNLAQALLRPCRWLLLDEPFAAVDRSTRLEILGWLKDWQKLSGTGIILVSHDLDDIFTVATDVTVVAGGEIVENSSLRDVLENPKHLDTAKLLRSGLILSMENKPHFVSSSKIFATREDLSCSDPNVVSFELKNAKVTQVGSMMRVVDFESGNDFTIPWSYDFQKTVWFDRSDARGV